MFRPFIKLLAVLVASLLFSSVFVAAANAAPRPGRIAAVKIAAQDVAAGKLRVVWSAAQRAKRYEVRLASTGAGLARAKAIRTSSRSWWTPRLAANRDHLIQVRAVRGGRVGSWSPVTRGVFTAQSTTVPTPGSVLARDAFNRSSTKGWGSADVGGVWAVTGSSAAASVVPGMGARFAMPAPLTQSAELKSVSSTRTRFISQFSVDRLVTGPTPQYVAVAGRKVGDDAYVARLRITADGITQLYLLRNTTSLQAPVVLPFRVQPGVRYNLAVQATGTNPTVVSAKAWPAASAEPTDWTLQASDRAGALQTAGHVGLFVYVPSGSGSGPLTTTVHSILGLDASVTGVSVPPPTPEPTPSPTPEPTPSPSPTPEPTPSPTPTPTPEPTPSPEPPARVPERGPVSFPSVQAMKDSGMYRIPSDANLVTWNFGNKTLEEAFMSLGANDILVLPERKAPYLLDSSDGFRAAGVGSVLGFDGKRIPIVSSYKGKAARTWFAMARAQRGVIGLGPGAVIEPTDSGFRQEAQIEDKGSPLPGGGTSPGRFWYNTAGVQQSEMVGAQEKLLETNNPNAYLANFTMRGRDFGGVAYNAIGMRGGTAERLDLDGAWRGFSAVPNTETGAINIMAGRYLISRVSTSPLDENGRRVGTSPIMINNSPGGRWEYGEVSQVRRGMPTIWRSSGRHEFVQIVSRWGVDVGVNLEQVQDGFEFVWKGGALWANRGNRGGHPSPDGIYGNALQVGLYAVGRASITFEDVDIDQSVQAGKLSIQLYNTPDPSKITARATNAGKAVPVVAYGTSGAVPLS